jgi:arginine decarboxylase
LRQWEGYFAYPGLKLLGTLNDRIASGEAIGTTRLARAISTALVTHSYRTNIEDWENEEDSVGNLVDRLPLSGEAKSGYRPYFRNHPAGGSQNVISWAALFNAA